MGSLKCSKCSGVSEIETFPLINTSTNPELKEKVKDGSLFVWECPRCGTVNLIQTPVLYHDPSAKLLFWLGGDSGNEAVKSVFESEEVLKSYTSRIVESVGELIEKVNIFDAGLDDIVLEIVKYVTSLEMEGSPQGLKFVNVSGADSEITLTYPKNGEMEMIAVGFNVYEDCCGIVNRNTVFRDKARGLVRIDRDWVSRFFK